MKPQKPYVQRRWLGDWVWIAWRPSGGGEFPFTRWEDAMSCALGQTYRHLPGNPQTRTPAAA